MKVLVVEDEPNNMKLMTLVLKKHGHEPVEAVSGEEGIKKAADFQPDLILIDIKLPDINGVEVTRRIKEMKTTNVIPIIAITSCAMAGDRDEIMKAGCKGYFEKPIDPLTIMDEINRMLKVK